MNILDHKPAFALVILIMIMGSAETTSAQTAPDTEVPLYDDLGSYEYAVTTSVDEAQLYFNQGVRLYYAFNHAEAIRAFREAQRLDPNCAMCWWGEALAWGPNINLPIDGPSSLAAYTAIAGAVERKSHASEKEQAMIDALQVRYA